MVDPFAALFGDVPKETKETKAAAVPNAPSAPSRVKISQAVQKAVPQESAGGKKQAGAPLISSAAATLHLRRRREFGCRRPFNYGGGMAMQKKQPASGLKRAADLTSPEAQRVPDECVVPSLRRC